MGHTEEACEHHFKDVGRNKVGEQVKSVEPMRYHGAAVREALIEVRNHTKDPAVKAEAQSLSEEVGSYRFSICTVVWYDMLSSI